MVADITYINGDVTHVYRDCIFYVHLCIPLAAACVYIYTYIDQHINTRCSTYTITCKYLRTCTIDPLTQPVNNTEMQELFFQCATARGRANHFKQSPQLA
jgi:hypothetical protein